MSRAFLRIFILGFGFSVGDLPPSAFAQDPFEIHVYDSEPLGPGQFTFEQHSNYVGAGARQPDGETAATDDQLHIAFELTAGLTKGISVGVMELNGIRPGGPGAEYAGWRVIPRFDAPASWKLPMEIGLVTEFCFGSTRYEDHSRAIDIIPIIGKSIGRFHVDFNPIIGRAIRGPATADGWVFSPAGRVGYQFVKRIAPSVEYYSSIGPLRDALPVRSQFHQILPGTEIRLRDDLVWSLGLGIGLTAEGNRLVYKSRLEWHFGRQRAGGS